MTPHKRTLPFSLLHLALAAGDRHRSCRCGEVRLARRTPALDPGTCRSQNPALDLFRRPARGRRGHGCGRPRRAGNDRRGSGRTSARRFARSEPDHSGPFRHSSIGPSRNDSDHARRAPSSRSARPHHPHRRAHEAGVQERPRRSARHVHRGGHRQGRAPHARCDDALAAHHGGQ